MSAKNRGALRDHVRVRTLDAPAGQKVAHEKLLDQLRIEVGESLRSRPRLRDSIKWAGDRLKQDGVAKQDGITKRDGIAASEQILQDVFDTLDAASRTTRDYPDSSEDQIEPLSFILFIKTLAEQEPGRLAQYLQVLSDVRLAGLKDSIFSLPYSCRQPLQSAIYRECKRRIDNCDIDITQALCDVGSVGAAGSGFEPNDAGLQRLSRAIASRDRFLAGVESSRFSAWPDPTLRVEYQVLLKAMLMSGHGMAEHRADLADPGQVPSGQSTGLPVISGNTASLPAHLVSRSLTATRRFVEFGGAGGQVAFVLPTGESVQLGQLEHVHFSTSSLGRGSYEIHIAATIALMPKPGQVRLTYGISVDGDRHVMTGLSEAARIRAPRPAGSIPPYV